MLEPLNGILSDVDDDKPEKTKAPGAAVVPVLNVTLLEVGGIVDVVSGSDESFLIKEPNDIVGCLVVVLSIVDSVLDESVEPNKGLVAPKEDGLSAVEPKKLFFAIGNCILVLSSSPLLLSNDIEGVLNEIELFMTLLVFKRLLLVEKVVVVLGTSPDFGVEQQIQVVLSESFETKQDEHVHLLLVDNDESGPVLIGLSTVSVLPGFGAEQQRHFDVEFSF
jgi:hypothetical protein